MIDDCKIAKCHCGGNGHLRARIFGKTKKYRYKCDKCGRWTNYCDTVVEALDGWGNEG